MLKIPRPADLPAATGDAKALLETLTRFGRPVQYTDLMTSFGWGSRRFYAALGSLQASCVMSGHADVSSLAVGSTNVPGAGWYRGHGQSMRTVDDWRQYVAAVRQALGNAPTDPPLPCQPPPHPDASPGRDAAWFLAGVILRDPVGREALTKLAAFVAGRTGDPMTIGEVEAASSILRSES